MAKREKKKKSVVQCFAHIWLKVSGLLGIACWN